MISNLIEHLKQDPEQWNQVKDYFKVLEVPPKAVLLREGEVAKNIYFIRKGCLRMWFNDKGKDITYQFFFENQPVASIDSFMNSEPSLFNIESIEPSIVISTGKEHFEMLCDQFPEMKEGFQNLIFQRFRNYAELFLSRIKDNPQQRYQDLIKNHPEIIQRIPQHYIASFLGITPISLSRIRNRK
jgi:CRP-like cAMP-binding protein